MRSHAPLLSGMRLGAATALTGVLLDQDQAILPEPALYAHALGMTLFNLLFLGPLVYAHVPIRWRPGRGPLRFVRTLLESVGLVGAHAALYSLAHRAMHKLRALRPIHDPHHRFKDVVIPSAANAVTPAEFLFAYMAPFAVSAWMHPPSPTSLNVAATVVSAFNLLVHTPSLATCSHIPEWWVDPKTHLEHHRVRLGRYAAPTFQFHPAPLLVASLALGGAVSGRVGERYIFFPPQCFHSM